MPIMLSPDKVEGIATPNIFQFPRVPKAVPDTPGLNYDIDDSGMRKHDCLGTKTLVTVGCSHTFGQGLESKHTWPQKLAEMLGYNLINVGTSGASVGICCTNLLWAIENYNVDLVVWYCPTPDRLEYFRKDKTIATTFGSYNFQDKRDPKATKKWAELHRSAMYPTHYINILQMIRQSFSMLKMKNIPSVFNYWGWDETDELFSLCKEYSVLVNTDPHKRNIPDIDRAMDKQHFGVNSHEEFAKNNYNLIKNQLTNL